MTNKEVRNCTPQMLQEIRTARGLSVSALAAEIDDGRGLDAGLASAIRVHVLGWYRDRQGRA